VQYILNVGSYNEERGRFVLRHARCNFVKLFIDKEERERERKKRERQKRTVQNCAGLYCFHVELKIT